MNWYITIKRICVYVPKWQKSYEKHEMLYSDQLFELWQENSVESPNIQGLRRNFSKPILGTTRLLGSGGREKTSQELERLKNERQSPSDYSRHLLGSKRRKSWTWERMGQLKKSHFKSGVQAEIVRKKKKIIISIVGWRSDSPENHLLRISGVGHLFFLISSPCGPSTNQKLWFPNLNDTQQQVKGKWPWQVSVRSFHSTSKREKWGNPLAKFKRTCAIAGTYVP